MPITADRPSSGNGNSALQRPGGVPEAAGGCRAAIAARAVFMLTQRPTAGPPRSTSSARTTLATLIARCCTPNNNTPVEMGVLWGCIWSEGWPEWSRTEAPPLDDDQQILDADGAVVVGVAGTGRCAVVATTRERPGSTERCAFDLGEYIATRSEAA